MKVIIKPSILKGRIKAVSSKSHIHRVILAASLCEEKTIIKNVNMSEDILATIKCAEEIGTKITFIDNEVIVFPKGVNSFDEISLDNSEVTKNFNCNESGSTLRFILPIIGALNLRANIFGKGRLVERPNELLVNELEKNGMNVTSFFGKKQNGFDKKLEEKLEEKSLKNTDETFYNKELENENSAKMFEVSGQLKPGKYFLDGNVSSQYFTGLLFALPLLSGDSEIVLKSPLQSKGYVDLTIETLNTFGIKIKENNNGYTVLGGQKYISPKEVTGQGDWSNGAFFLVAGALGGEITVDGLSINSTQGDKEIVNIIKAIGADVTVKNNSVTVKKNQINAIKKDVSNIPDLAPIMAVLASVATGESDFFNGERVRLKECDRLYAMQECLYKIGANITEKPDGLIIKGRENLKGGSVNSFNDHRIVMAIAVASVVSKGEIQINNAEAIAKSYPKFFEDFAALGGIINVI